MVGPLGPDSLADNVLASLRDLGHDGRGVETWTAGSRLVSSTQESQPLPYLGGFQVHAVNELERRPSIAARLQAGVVAAAEEHRPDLTVVLDRRLAVPLVPRLRAAANGAPVVLWYTDGLRQIGREAHLLGGYDAVFCTDVGLTERYRELRGLNAHLLPEACNPRWHRPPEEGAPGDAGPAVLVLGSVYTSRFLLLRRLVAAGVEIDLRGGHVSRVIPRDPGVHAARRGGMLVRADKASAFRRAAVVLNDVNSAETTHLNLRLFEAAASGGAVLTEWRDGLPELFQPGREVHAYRTFDQLLEGIRMLQSDPAAARAAGDAASARAHAEHTYAHRFTTMLEVLGLG